MILFKRVKEIRFYLKKAKANTLRIGFVPTMGALHEGHLSLIRQAKENCDIVVCSIFVNPTQFNEASDLTNYPRREAADIELLLGEDCDVLFLPMVEEMYPLDYKGAPDFDFGPIDKGMEGANRPGHFAGVAQVLHRFLDILNPDAMFMGQKDLQQFLVTRSMITQMKSAVDLVLCPIIRESNGLAMSSRNRRLSPDQLEIAAKISQTLKAAQQWKNEGYAPPEIQKRVLSEFAAIKEFRPEYVEVVETKTLQQINRFQENQETAICTAVWLEPVRLIDNMIFE